MRVVRWNRQELAARLVELLSSSRLAFFHRRVRAMRASIRRDPIVAICWRPSFTAATIARATPVPGRRYGCSARIWELIAIHQSLVDGMSRPHDVSVVLSLPKCANMRSAQCVECNTDQCHTVQCHTARARRLD